MKAENETLNVLGTPLKACCFSPMTGVFRDGYCKTNAFDLGTHTVCAQVTTAFLQFSLEQGNDLITPIPMYNFPGLKDGDFWCLCVSRWIEAHNAGVAPSIRLDACHSKTLDYLDITVLNKYAIK